MEALADILAALALPLAIVGFLATVAEAVVEGFISPLFKRYKLDTFWLFYVAWAVSFALVLLSGVNLFGDFIPADTVALAWVGRVLTAIIAGRGSNFLHDLFSAKRTQADQGKVLRELREKSWTETRIPKD